MFGQHHDGGAQNDQSMASADITEDGTLGIPAPSSSIGAPVTAGSDETDSSSSSPVLPQSFRQSSLQATAAPAEPAMTLDGSTDTGSANDLIGIKQAALQQLKPLVGHLDQTPEEKFRTAMMMIQAADDQSLISDAYEAAKSITDEKTRAQALLDVVNEINYFTSQNTQA